MEAVGRGSGCGDCSSWSTGTAAGRGAGSPTLVGFGLGLMSGRLGTGRSQCLSGSGCLSVQASAVPCTADVSPAALCGLDSGASHTAILPLFVFEIQSHKAANHILLWVKELSV